jgi:hypothetical protein
MPPAAKKPATPDLALILGDEDGGEDPLAGMMEEEPASEGDDMPPGFLTAFDEWKAADGEGEAAAMYRMIEACKGGL